VKRLALALGFALVACNQRDAPRHKPPDLIVTKPAPPRRVPPPLTVCPVIIVTLAQDGASVGDGAAARAIAPCGTSIDHTALALQLCDAIKARACDGQMIIRVDANVAHGEVVSLMELAKRAGVTRLAIGTGATASPNGTPAPARCDEPTPTSCP